MAATLKSGAKGEDVTALQNALNAQGYNLAVDGIFGGNTLSAVKDYQNKMGLTVDGIVGTNTWGALGGGASGNSNTGSSTAGLQEIPGQTAGGAVSGGTSGTGVPGGDGTSGASAWSGTVENPNYTYQQLLDNIRGSQQAYTPKTAEEIAQEAKNQYDPIYNATKLAAEQAAEKQRLALEQELAAQGRTYDKQRETTAEAFTQAYSQADRQALSRGMQRSSYNNQTLANIDTQGAKAQAEIGEAQTLAEQAIAGNITLNETQLAQTIQQLEVDYATNVAAYEDALRDKDYDRADAQRQRAQDLETALYELGLQQQSMAMSQSQWEREFAENQRQFDLSYQLQQQQLNKTSGGGGNTGATPKQNTQQNAGGTFLDSILDKAFNWQSGNITSNGKGFVKVETPTTKKTTGGGTKLTTNYKTAQ